MDIPVITLEDSFEEADAIVVTAISYFGEIKDNIRKKANRDIISLEDILYSL